MKLLFIHDHRFYQEGESVYSGGSLTRSLWENNYLHSFELLTVVGRKSSNIFDKKSLSSGNPKVNFHLIDSSLSFHNIVLNYRKIFRQIKYLIENHDMVIIRLPSLLGFMAGRYMVKKNITFLVEQVGNCKEALQNVSLKGKISSKWLHRLNGTIVKKAPYVIYVTRGNLQSIYPTTGKFTDISNVILPTILTKEYISPDRFTKRRFKIGLLGTFNQTHKGQKTLLQAVAILPEAVKNNVELYFAGQGDGGWILSLSRKLGLEKRIKFVGAITPGPEILDFLKNLTLYTQPSFTEGLPRALLEAMSMGCPALASDVGGIPDVLDRRFLHSPGDFSTLSVQILALYNDRRSLYECAVENLQTAEYFRFDLLREKRKDFLSMIKQEIAQL